MKNSFCLGRVWQVLVAISLLLSQIAFAQNITNQSIEILNEAPVQDMQNQEQPINNSLEGSVGSDTIINETSQTPSQTNTTEINNTTASDSSTVNETTNNETSNLTAIPTPKLNADIFYPEKLTRGETIEIKAVVTNTGSVDINNAVISWILPNGFEIISKQENCSSLASRASCDSVITVKTSTNAELGPNQAKVVVNYG